MFSHTRSKLTAVLFVNVQNSFTCQVRDLRVTICAEAQKTWHLNSKTSQKNEDIAALSNGELCSTKILSTKESTTVLINH